jgi:hypothetical protein
VLGSATSENAQTAKFVEFYERAVRRIPILGTSVNRPLRASINFPATIYCPNGYKDLSAGDAVSDNLGSYYARAWPRAAQRARVGVPDSPRSPRPQRAQLLVEDPRG